MDERTMLLAQLGEAVYTIEVAQARAMEAKQRLAMLDTVASALAEKARAEAAAKSADEPAVETDVEGN